MANALLFLLIGLAIEPALITAHPGAIPLAILAVLVARALAVAPLISALERIASPADGPAQPGGCSSGAAVFG